MKARVSVIIPLYNNARYIEECVGSVIRQTLAPHEIIVVDDGSTDGGGELLDNYQQVTLITQKNQGVTAARRNGVAHATGDWIFFLDSDDTLQPAALEHLAAKTGADVDIVVSRAAHEQSLTGEGFLEATFNRHVSREVWGRLYRRTLFDDGFALGVPREIRLGEDLLMNFRLGGRLKGKVETITDDDYNYRRHNTQTVKTVLTTSDYEIMFDRELCASFTPEDYTKYLPQLTHFRIGEYLQILLCQNQTRDFGVKQTEWFKSLLNDTKRPDCHLTSWEWTIMHLVNRHNVHFLAFAFDLPRILKWKIRQLFSR